MRGRRNLKRAITRRAITAAALAIVVAVATTPAVAASSPSSGDRARARTRLLELEVDLDRALSHARVLELAIGLDRDHDFDPDFDFDLKFDFDRLCEKAGPKTLGYVTNPLSAGVDLMVRIAKLPASGATLAQHLLTAAAKTPLRVLQTLL